MVERHPLVTVCIGALVAAAAAHSAWADVIEDWNEVVLDAIRATRTPPPPATRALAMTHVAMFDAVNGIERGYEPYAVDRKAPPGASPEAAAAMAAYTVLLDVFPQRSAELRAALEASLSSGSFSAARHKGVAWGRYCGRKIVALRAHDGAAEFVPYTPTDEPGRWRPTPPAFAPALLPQWPYVRPFAMRRGDQFRPAPPPALTDAAFTSAFTEVKEIGSASSATRSADQTLIAYFWEDGSGTATPPGHWQMIARDLVAGTDADLTARARLFALLSIVQADAAIASWDAKYAYDHVRPYTAIVEDAAVDGNPDTVEDAAWTSLIPTPPFPAYTSGHSTFSGGSARLLALFFGTDEIEFSSTSPDPQRWPDILPGVVRSFTRLSDAAAEAGQSRIYGGIHWQYDNQAGLAAGSALADRVFGRYLRPLPDDPRGPRPNPPWWWRGRRPH